ncbi:MAG: methyltransferase domain-containing protein [Pseudomonadota bacterium]
MTTKTTSELEWLHAVRDHELAVALDRFPEEAETRVLEIGSGTGYMLGLLRARYPDAVGLEVEGSAYSYSDSGITQYDGRTIPHDAGSFDVVFSSHVLEHVADIEAFLVEIHRVLKPGGLSIHVIPSPTWRVMTSLMHYFALARTLLSSLTGNRGEEIKTKAKGRSRAELLRYALYAPRHGERGTVLTEAWFFSRRYWNGVFASPGMQCEEPVSGGIVYWGNDLFRNSISLRSRKTAAGFLGASSYVYAARKAAAAGESG